jgi:hypothetical protein
LKATRSCLATTGLAVWMRRVGDKRRGRGSGVVSDGERTAGGSIRGWRRFARAARGVVERVAASSTPPFPGRTRLDFEPEPPPSFFFLFQQRAPCVAGAAHHGVVGAAHEGGGSRRAHFAESLHVEGVWGKVESVRNVISGRSARSAFPGASKKPPPRLLPPGTKRGFSEWVPYAYLVTAHNLPASSRPRETPLARQPHIFAVAPPSRWQTTGAC